MNYQKSFALVLALLALVCNFNSTAFAADTSKKSNNKPEAVSPTVKRAELVVKKTELAKSATSAKTTKTETRYRSTSEFVPVEKVGFTQPKYVGPETLNGLGLKSAAELGHKGKKIFNEWDSSARIVILDPLAQIYYDTASMEPLYLFGCLRDGKPYANRIKLLEPLEKAPEPTPSPTPTVTPAPTPVVQVTPAPTPTVTPTLPYDENQGVREVRIKKPTTNFVDEVEAGYDVRFEGGKGNIAVVPAIEVDQTIVVVDVPKPTIRANGRKMPLGD